MVIASGVFHPQHVSSHGATAVAFADRCTTELNGEFAHFGMGDQIQEGKLQLHFMWIDDS